MASFGGRYEVPISVSDHAYWRAAERFPWFDTATIEDEIRAALREKRVSQAVPPGVTNDADPNCLYAWTPDGRRIYVLTVNRFEEGRNFAVKTVLRAKEG